MNYRVGRSTLHSRPVPFRFCTSTKPGSNSLIRYLCYCNLHHHLHNTFEHLSRNPVLWSGAWQGRLNRVEFDISKSSMSASLHGGYPLKLCAQSLKCTLSGSVACCNPHCSYRPAALGNLVELALEILLHQHLLSKHDMMTATT